MEEFFGQLRRLASMVERETNHLENEVKKPPSMRTPEGSPILILRELQQQTQATKKDLQHSLDDFKDSDFLELVSSCQELVQQQEAAVSQVEEHLSQYGYQPLTQDTEVPPVETKEELAAGASSQHLGQGDVPRTPEKTSSPLDMNGEPKTPQLEDFVSTTSYSRYINQHKPHTPEALQLGHLTKTADTARSKTPELQDFMINSNAIDGQKTPDPPSSMLKSAHRGMDRAKAALVLDLNSQPLVDGQKTPEMPGFTRAHKDMDNPEAPEPPDGMPQPMADGLRTPVTPEGLKQVHKGMDNLKVSEPPSFMPQSLTADLNTPETPECFTQAFTGINNMRVESRGAGDGPKTPEELHFNQSPTLQSSRKGGSVTSPQTPDFPEFSTGRSKFIQKGSEPVSRYPGVQSQNAASPTYPELKIEGMTSPTAPAMSTTVWDNITTPETPETTSVNVLVGQFNSKIDMTNNNHHEMESPASPVLRNTGFRNRISRFERPDISSRLEHINSNPTTPEMPEPTIKMSSRLTSRMNEQHAWDGISVPDVPGLDSAYNVDGIAGKENVPDPSRMIASLGEDEYTSLPNYIRRHLSYDLINDSINKINNILWQRRQGTEDSYIMQTDLSSDIGALKARTIFLSLVKLSRLKYGTGNGLEKVFRLP